MTPVEFLTARLDEREAIARAAIGTAVFQKQTGRWSFEHVDIGGHGLFPFVFALADGGGKTQVADLSAAWEANERGAHIAANDPAYALADIAAKRAILEWHQNWPVLVEKQPTFDQPAMATDFSSVTESVTVRLSRQIAWLTEQEYRNRFGSEPPTGPIIRLMLRPFAEHPDFDPRWSA